MVKQDTKTRILEHAGRLVRLKGFNHTGIQEILESAGVPKGSFYFYFRSKDDLGLALINYYAELIAQKANSLFDNAEGAALEKLLQFFQGMRELFEQDEWRSGCPIGNLSQEMSLLNESFRSNLQRVFSAIQRKVRDYIVHGQAQGDIDPRLDPNDLAQFIVDSWEGALLRMKVEQSTQPLLIFEKMIFSHMLSA
jgi:TetR/AcrR family transcriptional regulator, transcriptional repressor for nem operon